MNLRRCYEDITHTKNAIIKKILQKGYEKTYDSLLADLGKHQTRMQ